MDGIIDVKNEIFVRIVDDLQKSIKRYEKFPPEQRFLMLTDKVIMIISLLKTLMVASTQDQIRKIEQKEDLSVEQKSEKTTQLLAKCDKIGNIFELVRAEFNALEDFIQNDTKSILSNIEEKLNEVLLGPYYAAGQELMKTASKEFDKNKI